MQLGPAGDTLIHIELMHKVPEARVIGWRQWFCVLSRYQAGNVFF
jgi:hypothetical protein